jgi:dTDP-4-dehydrorhamnose reductase
MTISNILIFGANGMLGRYITCYLTQHTDYNIVQITRREIDVSIITYDKLSVFLKKYNNSIIINCIGIIPQRYEPSNESLYLKINTVFPHLLSKCCLELNFKFIHISTDCVFNGNTHSSYLESDISNEIHIYGSSKYKGEPSNATIIRTSIIGEELENKQSFLEWILKNNNNIVNGYIDHYWNGVTCLQLSKIIIHMIQFDIFWKGVRHLYSPSIISKYELIKLISEIYNINITVNKHNTSIVNKTLASNYPLFYNIPDLKTQLIEQCAFNLF